MGNNNEDKLRALDAALGQIEKQYGKGAVMKLGDSAANMNVETIPTGSLSLDIALGLGGVPKGRIIEVYGPKYRNAAESPASSMQSMRSIRPMPKTSVLILKTSISHSRTTASRHLRSPRRWSVPVR